MDDDQAMSRNGMALLADSVPTYTDWRDVDGDVQCIAPFMFTWAILTGVDATGYKGRYCYDSLAECRGAFNEWDGKGEPDGWHRATVQGEPMRRVDDDGNVYESS